MARLRKWKPFCEKSMFYLGSGTHNCFPAKTLLSGLPYPPAGSPGSLTPG